MKQVAGGASLKIFGQVGLAGGSRGWSEDGEFGFGAVHRARVEARASPAGDQVGHRADAVHELDGMG